MNLHAVGKYFGNPLLANPFAKMNKIARIEGKRMFEKYATAEVLKVNITNPIIRNLLIPKIV
jgi:hypothetical protein